MDKNYFFVTTEKSPPPSVPVRGHTNHASSTGFASSRACTRAAQKRTCSQHMFARRAEFGLSVFSPEKKPRIIQYLSLVKKVKNEPPPVKIKRTVDITKSLGTDELASLMMVVYAVCKTAPMCAAVSRTFKVAKDTAEEASKALHVAPHRHHMKLAASPSLIPSMAEDNAVIHSWGNNLESFAPVRACTRLHAPTHAYRRLHTPTRACTRLHAPTRACTGPHAPARAYMRLHAPQRVYARLYALSGGGDGVCS